VKYGDGPFVSVPLFTVDTPINQLYAICLYNHICVQLAVGGCFMGRQARKIRDSNIYHVMLRGVDRQVSFEDQQDEDKFLSLLNRYRLRCGFAVYGLRTVLQAVIVNILAQPLRLLAQPLRFIRMWILHFPYCRWSS